LIEDQKGRLAFVSEMRKRRIPLIVFLRKESIDKASSMKLITMRNQCNEALQHGIEIFDKEELLEIEQIRDRVINRMNQIGLRESPPVT